MIIEYRESFKEHRNNLHLKSIYILNAKVNENKYILDLHVS